MRDGTPQNILIWCQDKLSERSKVDSDHFGGALLDFGAAVYSPLWIFMIWTQLHWAAEQPGPRKNDGQTMSSRSHWPR